MKFLLTIIFLSLSNLAFAGCISGNCASGYGTYLFEDAQNKGDKYIGEFKNNEFSGLGTYYFTNGDIYSGQFKNGAPNGIASFNYAVGAKYIGEFKNGLMHGLGTYTYSGTKYVGEFENGEYNGQGTYTDANGNTFRGIFKDSQLVTQN